MATSEEDITRGHELYLRHLLLLGQAAPIALKAVVEREVNKRGRNLSDLISETRSTIHQHYKAYFHQLPQDDKYAADIDSWDTRLLCIVTLVLFNSDLASSELEALKCIIDQRSDLENYVHVASLNYKTFKGKRDLLHSALLQLITDIHGEARFDFKQMFYSFKSGHVIFNTELINKMKQTMDVELQVQLAIKNKVVPKIHGEGENQDEMSLKYENPVFKEMLQDKFVYVDESAILACKLSDAWKTVEWRKNYKPIEETENIKFLADECTHWLAIYDAQLTDTGHYTCVCGNSSTSAFLNVSEKPLKITEELHVDTVEKVVRENMDIVLSCKVNLLTNKVVWRHNGEEIKQFDRLLVSVHELEHKLTIRNTKFEDEGDYVVDFGSATSRILLSIQGNDNLLLKHQISDDLYKNWIRGALGLKYLKIGLEVFSDITVNQHHNEFLKRLSSTGTVCTNCTAEILLPSHKKEHCPKRSNCLCSQQRNKRKRCPNGGFCSTFYDLIVCDHRFLDPLMANTYVDKWSSEPWSVATCYISTTGYKDKTSSKDVDCSGLLNLFINNIYFHTSLGDVEINGETDLFKQAKDVRNDILHNANYELSEGQLHDYIDLFINVLEVKDKDGGTPLLCQPGVQEATGKLKELRRQQIDIHISKDLRSHIKDIQEHAMRELGNKMKEAEKQKHIQLQQLQEQLKKTEEDLQLMRDMRSAQLKHKEQIKPKVPFDLALHIEAVGPTGETITEGNQRMRHSLKVYLAKHSMQRNNPFSLVDQSVHRLLGYIDAIENCEVVEVLDKESAACIKIHCFTCEAIDAFLKLINGNEFRKETAVLRKGLQIQEHIKAFDVTTSCSSASIEHIRKRLHGVFRGSSSELTCTKHQGTQCTWFCSDHDQFCCSTCKDSDHRACDGIKQVVSERSYGKQKQSLIVKRTIGNFNVQIKNYLTNRDYNDVDDCKITSVRMLPNGEIILIDRRNSKLKKLDSSIYIVGQCYLQECAYDVCYIGNDRIAASLLGTEIQIVNISGNMRLEQVVKLDHYCYALACHGDTIYVKSDATIYSYNRYFHQQRLLYSNQDLGDSSIFRGIAVSDDGERIYITTRAAGLITIDNSGKHMFTLKCDVLNISTDVCVVGDGTLLVFDGAGRVHQVDYKGEKVLGTVVDCSDGIENSESFCYDRRTCRLIVANFYGNNISVFKLQRHNPTSEKNG